MGGSFFGKGCLVTSKGKDAATIALCAVLGLGAIGGIGCLTMNRVDAMVDNASSVVSRTSDELAQAYADKLDYYEMVEQHLLGGEGTTRGVDVAPGIELPSSMVPTDAEAQAAFVAALEDAGVDPSRVIMSDDGTWVYLIEHGDTLTKLSAAFGYSVDELADFNHVRDVNLIYAESALRIPGQ